MFNRTFSIGCAIILAVIAFAIPARASNPFESPCVAQTLSRRTPTFDTGVQPVNVTHDVPLMLDTNPLATITMPQGAWVKLGISYWNDMLVENLQPTSCATWTYVMGAYASIGDVNLAVCNAFTGPLLGASDDIPVMPDQYDGEHLCWTPGADNLICPVALDDVFATMPPIYIPAGTWQVRVGTYAVMTEWNGVTAPPYIGHFPWRALCMNERARLWGRIVPQP